MEDLLEIADRYSRNCFEDMRCFYIRNREEVQRAIEIDKEEMKENIEYATDFNCSEDTIRAIVYGALDIIDDYNRSLMLDDIEFPILVSLAKGIRENIDSLYCTEYDRKDMLKTAKEFEHAFAIGRYMGIDFQLNFTDVMKINNFTISAVTNGLIVKIENIEFNKIVFSSYASYLKYDRDTGNETLCHKMSNSIAIRNIEYSK